MSCLMGKSQLGSRDREAADLRDQRRTEGYGAHDSLKPVELTCGYLRLRAGFRFDKRPHITFVHPARWVRTPDGQQA